MALPNEPRPPVKDRRAAESGHRGRATDSIVGQRGDMAAEEARERLSRVRGGVAVIRDDLVELYLRRAWLGLGYSSWDELCDRELDGARIALPLDERREVVSSMRSHGLSTRAIASAIGASEATVRRDVEATASHDAVEAVVSLDGRTRPARGTRTGRKATAPSPAMWPMPSDLLLTAAMSARGLISVHPMFAHFPSPGMGEEAWHGFVESVARFGVISQVYATDDGVLLDGRSRLIAAHLTGRDCPVTRVPLADDESRIDFVCDKNLMRPHLTEDQLAMAFVRLEKLLSDGQVSR